MPMKCQIKIIVLQNRMQRYVYFLRQKEDSIEEGNVTEVEEELRKYLRFFLQKG